MILRMGIIFERKKLNFNNNIYNVYKAIDVAVGGWGVNAQNISEFFPLKKRCQLCILDEENKNKMGNDFDNYKYYAGCVDTNDFFDKYYYDNVDYDFVKEKEKILKKWDGFYTLGTGMNLNRITTQDAIDECEIIFNVKKENNRVKERNKILSEYGIILNDKEYLNNPAIGRNEEIENLEIALLSYDKSAMIVGESGVGKTAIVEGLAYKIKNGLVPNKLKDIEIFSISTSSLVSGCKYVGMVEERMETIIDELKKNKNIIMYIDEIHTVVGAGAGEKSNLDIANILKPYLDRGDIKIIGSTTKDEYNKLINDPAFKRRFSKINVLEPNKDILLDIIKGTIKGLENYYNIKFKFANNEFLDLLINLTSEKNRDYSDKENNPALVLSIIKDAFAIASLYDHDEVILDDIVKAIKKCDKLYTSIREKYSLNLENMFRNNHMINEVSESQKHCKILKFPHNNF